MKKDKNSPRPGFIAAGVFFTIMSSIMVYVIKLEIAFNNYRTAHHLSDVSREIIFGIKVTEPANVEINDLTNFDYYGGVLFVALIMIILYPLLAKIISYATAGLEKIFIRIYRVEVNEDDIFPFLWQSKFGNFEFGSIWPITFFYTLFLIIAVTVGGIYRLIWPNF